MMRQSTVSRRVRVRERPAAAQTPDPRHRLEEAARWFAVQARQLGADSATALARARDALDGLAR